MKLATLAIAQQDALVRAAVLALHQLDDDDGDVIDVSHLAVDLMSGEDLAVDIAMPDLGSDAERGPDDEKRAAREDTGRAAWHLLTQLLSGAAIPRRALDDARRDHGEDDLLVALSAVSDALVELLKKAALGDPLAFDVDVTAVLRARADARQLLTNPKDAPAAAPTGLPRSTDPPRPARSAVAAALDSLMDQAAVDESVADGEAKLAPSALLRVRAFTTEAARSLAAVAAGVVGAADVIALPHAADELVLSAAGKDKDAVALLVRAATGVAQALPEGAALSFALVKGSGDLVADVVRAGGLLPRAGLLALDDDAFALQNDLAIIPGAGRVIDPRAPYGQERWELSALLMRPPLVGRDDDVKVCADVLAASAIEGASDPRLLLLFGPAGIGKSALLRAGLSEAGLLDERAVVLWGAADPLQPTPYAAVVGMIRALARAPAGHPRGSIRVSHLVKGLADALPTAEANELLALQDVVVDLLGAGSADDEDDVAERRSPRMLRTSIRRAVLLMVKALLARAGDQRPAVFVVSGAEAMDTPTRETLAFVARRLGSRARVVLLASQKPRWPPAFEEGFVVARREVKPLDLKSARALCNALLDIDDPNASTSASSEEPVPTARARRVDTVPSSGPLEAAAFALFERARGSPLFVAHAVRWAVEGGFLKKSPGVLGGNEWNASHFHTNDDDGDHDDRIAVPNRLDKLLHARVLRLPETARRVLGHCAALGLTFLPAAVEYVGVHLGIPKDDVLRAVRLLTETGFLARSQRRPGAPVFVDDDDAGGHEADALLVFEHPLLRAAAEQALHDDEAIAVHGVVADALEALLDTHAIAPTLARHHKIAGRRRQAVQHLVVAVRRARRLDDRHGATAMAREGLDLCTADEKDTRFTLQLELCAALEQGNSGAGAAANQKAFKDALKLLVRYADQTEQPRSQASAFARVARFNLFTGDLEKAEDAALRALERSRAGVTENARGPRDILRLLALIRFARRDLDGAHRALDEARRLTAPEDRRVKGVIEHQTGLFHLESNDPLGALEHLLLAREHKKATADLAGEAACLDAIADVYIRTGRLWTALSLLMRALTIRQAIGDDAGFAQSLKNRADVLLMAGDVDAAREEAGRARTLARSLSLERLEHQAAIVVARADLAHDDAAAAEAILDNVRRRVDDKRDPFATMEAELLSGRAKWLRAQTSVGGARDRLLKTAMTRAQAAIAIGERRGFLSGQVLGNALMGDVLVSTGDPGKALPYAQRATELLDDRSATGLPVEDALGTWARVMRALGDDDEAESALRRARVLLELRARRLPEEMRERFWAVPARRGLRGPAQGPVV